MSKPKLKKYKVPVGGKNDGIADMFNQMLGTGSINMGIAYPRYKRMRGLCEQLVKLFEMLARSPTLRTADLAPQRRELEEFCEKSKRQIAELFAIDLSDYEWNLALVDTVLKERFVNSYEQAKQSELVNEFVVMCDRLVKYKKNFADLDNTDHRFVLAMPGVEWCPFGFTTLNLKQMLSMMDITDNTIKFLMMVLGKAFELSHRLYMETQTPDIDIDQFVDAIMASIDTIQKQPELSRCRRAFSKIKESVEMLKTRFNGYYRDFIATRDNTIMMQHFITDVAKQTDADPKLTGEFHRIISYYRKMAQNNVSDPKVRAMFDKIGEHFNSIARNTENLANIDTDDSDDSHDGAAEHTHMHAGTRVDVNTHMHAGTHDLELRKAAAEKTPEQLAAEIEGKI